MSLALPAAPLRPDRRQLFAFCCALAIGVAAFVGVTGGGIARPSNLGWLHEGDPAQHYLGWSFFRHAPWQLPLGANPDYGMELGSSIVYTDSIPLLAFLVKPFSPLLPTDFQYFGLWVLGCFCLQAVFARRLLARLTPSIALQLVGAAFFVLAPPFLWRLRGHEALFGHWLLLAGLDAYFAPSFRRRAWLALIALSVLVHAYLWAMVTAIWIADLGQRILNGGLGRARAAAEAAAGLALAVAIMTAAGYFMGGGALAASGYGFYRLNLASPFDSDEGWSRLLPDLPQVGGDYEGFAFLGVGMWIIVLAALALVLRSGVPRWPRARTLPLAVLCAGLLAFAVSHHVGFGSLRILSFHLPFRALAVLGVFRSSGRFVWPVLYLVYLGAFRVVFRAVLVRPLAIVVGIGLLTLQLVDSSPALGVLRARLERPATPSPLAAPFWGRAARLYRRVIVVPPRSDDSGPQPLAHFAADAGMAIDSGYFARVDAARLTAERAQTLERLARQDLDPEALYVFTEGYTELAPAAARPGDLVGDVDGLRVLAPGVGRRGDFDPGSEFQVLDLLHCPATAVGRLSFGQDAPGNECLAYGWSRPSGEGVWARASRSGLLLRLGASAHARRTLRVDASYEPTPETAALAERRVRVYVNGVRLDDLRYPMNRERQSFELPITSLPADAIAALVEFEVPAGNRQGLPPRFARHGVGLKLFEIEVSPEK